MDEMDKLEHLLGHWREHNTEHARNYTEWAARAEAHGRTEVAGLLREIAQETVRMQSLFEQAQELMQGTL